MQITGQDPAIPEDEISYSFIRGAGPGGQNVNKVATAVQLRLDVRNSPSLSPEVKLRLMELVGKRLTQEGVLVIEAKRYRTQEQNRKDADRRLATWIGKAMAEPKQRRPTRPTQASRERRLGTKKRRARTKLLRAGKLTDS